MAFKGVRSFTPDCIVQHINFSFSDELKRGPQHWPGPHPLGMTPVPTDGIDPDDFWGENGGVPLSDHYGRSLSDHYLITHRAPLPRWGAFNGERSTSMITVHNIPIQFQIYPKPDLIQGIAFLVLV